MIFIRVIEPCLGRNKNEQTKRYSIGSFPKRGYRAFVEHMLFAITAQTHDQSGQRLNDTPGALKDNIRKILNVHLFFPYHYKLFI
jgi:hypothetical protein